MAAHPVSSLGRGRRIVTKRAQNPEKLIAIELVLAVVAYVGVTLKKGHTPVPRRIAALMAVFAILGVVTMFGPKYGRLAYLFGGLLLMGLVVFPVGEALAPHKAAAAKAAGAAALSGLKASVFTGG